MGDGIELVTGYTAVNLSIGRLITNRVTAAPREAAKKTVEIDSTTANDTGSMTISLLTVSAPSAAEHTLFR